MAITDLHLIPPPSTTSATHVTGKSSQAAMVSSTSSTVVRRARDGGVYTTDLNGSDRSPSPVNFSVEDNDCCNPVDEVIPAAEPEDAGPEEPECGATSPSRANEQDQEEEMSKSGKPFHRWMRTLHRRAVRRNKGTPEGRLSPHYMSGNGLVWASAFDRETSSNSSFGFVDTVKTASISVASGSLLARSRRKTFRSSREHSRTDRSSRASMPGVRLSEDSCPDRSILVDPAVTERSLQRRRILEELISTEESYISDVRFLMNVYITILASLPTVSTRLKSSINRNLTDIVELHEEMLGELHRSVPDSEYTQLEIPAAVAKPPVRGHHRWKSLDAVPENNGRASWLHDVPGMTSEPQVAAEVAKVFSRKMNRFFIYEEYGAKYELMIKDVTSANRAMPRWESYQKGLEALAASLGSENSQADNAKKSLTIGDLLVKPIQRVCKYPLLFADLLKHTPVIDCPYSHMEIENTLIRLREATAEINRATDDDRMKAVLERTWVLQDRLIFANQNLDAASKNRIRAFGHVQLCGALHVCWQTREGVDGQYMIALLYREWLCLATASRTDQIYTIQACLALNNIKIEETDNGRGLQCHTAPYSWKLVFICDHQLYEIILTACTPKEELEWRTRLNKQILVDSPEQAQPAFFTTLSLGIKTLGTVFGKPGTIARKISIHRATTVGPKSPMCQVILKNTCVIKDKDTQNSGGATHQINRSQSLLATNGRIPTLAPARGERARLEAILQDVWTRDILPFPGITTRSRSEHIVKASASSVMRKLSVASIASSFTKRSASLASLHKPYADDKSAPSSGKPKEGPPPSVAHLEVSQEACKSLLSVIPDESEQRSPSTPKTEPEWTTTDVFSTVRRLEPSHIPTEYAAEDILGPPTLTLCPASTNSSRPVSRQGSIAATKGSTHDSEKENMQHAKPSGSCKTSSRKFSSRWGRVGGLHREVVVQGIRSLFR